MRDALLRTLAAVAPGSRIVVLGLADEALPADLARLGFDVWASGPTHVEASRAAMAEVVADASDRITSARLDALGYPDAYADWVVVPALTPGESLAEARRVLRDGGWIWLALDGDTDAALALADAHDLAIAETPTEHGERVRVILRRTDGDAIA